MLRNLMEDKQLDFNAPLLSVRRFSSTTSSEGENSKRSDNSMSRKLSLPRYKSELKSGPVRNPGAVPFLWEQIPGRPKDREPLERPPIAPRLPPGRILEVKKQSSDKKSEATNVNRTQNDNVLPICKRIDDNVTKLESSGDGTKEKEDSDSEDGDDAFTDALDTMSRTESFFFNCSVSGLSGLDGPDVKPSGVFSTDPQTRDFMMGRFLPAAKAMASETPQYAQRKQPVTQQQPRELPKVVNGDRRPPLRRYRPNIVPQYVQDTGEEESEDEDDDFDDTGNLSAKACGLFPRFCLKNSFCLLNPVPGVKVRSHSPLTSVRKVSSQVKTSSSGSHSETEYENNWDVVYKHKLLSGLQPLEDDSKLTSESNQLTYWSDSQTPDGSSSYRNSGGSGISPYRNDAPQSPFHEGMGFLGIPKQCKSFKAKSHDPYKNSRKNFHEILLHHNGKRGSGSLSPTVEKTLYVDSVHVLETSNSNLSSSDSKKLLDCADKDSEIPVQSRGMQESPVAVSCLQDIKNLTISKDRCILQPKISEVIGANLQSSFDSSNLGKHRDSMDGFRKDDDLDQESRSLTCLSMPISGNLEFDKPQLLEVDEQGISNVNSLMAPLPPPLPKSPSESWLWRTLPSVSSRNGAQLHARKQASKTPSIDPKWETIVKTQKF